MVERFLVERGPAVLVVFVVVCLVVAAPLFLEVADLIAMPQRVENLLFYAFVALLVVAALGIPTLLIVLVL